MEEKLEVVALENLTLDPNNARKHSTKNLEAIAGSLKQFGQRKPIVVTEKNVVIAGNGTVEAARTIGWKGLNVVRVPKDWDDAKIKAYALADNRSAELAEWDNTILLEQLRELDLSDWNISELGFGNFELDPKEVIPDTDYKDLGERYEVVIECSGENEQTALLLRLSEEGLRVRAIII